MALQGKNVKPEKRTGYTYLGKEILLTRTRGRPLEGIQKRVGWYPESKRIEVATLFATCGNVETVSSLASVPRSTVSGWLRDPEFQSLLEAIRAENDHLIDAKQTEIIHSALEQIGDRVQNGDFKVLRDGGVVRVPMSGRDLSLVEAINLDKRQLLRGKPTSRTEQVTGPNKTVEDKLEELASNFRKIAKGTPIKQLDVTDVEIIEERPNDA